MDGACRTYRGQERCLQEFWWGYLRERDYSEALGVDGRIILNGFGMGACTRLIWLRIWTGGGRGCEPSVYTV